MRLRTFEAPTMAEALQRMRRELGGEAVLVASQPHAGGVRVTAALGTAGEDLAGLLDQGPGGRHRATLAACLEHHAVVPALRDLLLAGSAGSTPEATPAATLAALLTGRYRFQPLALAPERPLALVGPPGSGKTAALARLAAAHVLGGGTVQVVSADGARAGAAAQLEAFLAPLGLRPAFAATARELARATQALPAGTALLLDTSGTNPFEAAATAALAELLRAARAEPVLVLPAGLDAADSVDTAGSFVALGVRRMLVSRLDLARRLGGILAAADLGLVLAGAGIGPAIGRGPAELTALGLARLLLHRAGQQP
ncbi:MAG: GTPase [Geminicoccaceae bacterium]